MAKTRWPTSSPVEVPNAFDLGLKPRTATNQIIRAVEAYQAILQSLRLREDGEPSADDHFIFGRIAEEHGFVGAAREAYLRVPRGEGRSRYTTWELAQRRLKRLGKGD